MKVKEEIEELEKVTGQLISLHSEATALAKKSPTDPLNKFKLNMINKVLEAANKVLGKKYKPFVEFDHFDPDDLPTTSDSTMVLGQYIEEAERYRSDNLSQYGGRWYYVLSGERTNIESGPPSKIGRK